MCVFVRLFVLVCFILSLFFAVCVRQVELTQDEVSKVAGQLCRLQSEMEALGGQLTGRVDHSYLAPSSPLKTAQARKGKTADPWGIRGAAPASPMLLRTSLSELEVRSPAMHHVKWDLIEGSRVAHHYHRA